MAKSVPTTSGSPDSAGIRYGPNNPHPLSTLRTELVWEGKYDEYGNRREVDFAGSAMPLQRIETVDEPRARIEAQGGLFDSSRAHLDDFRNILVWGENKLVIASLLATYRGQLSLIYIDPPFDVGADFTMQLPIGDSKETVDKDQSVLEMVAYRDIWGRQTDSYVFMMYERLVLMRELLADTGTIYVHCDQRMGPYLRQILDEIFGRENRRATLIWQKLRSVKSQSSHFANMHDVILVYSKGESFLFNPRFVPKDPKLLETHYRHEEPETGRRYNLADFTQAGQGPPRRFGDKVLDPPGGKHWIWSQERIDEGMASGRIVFSSSGMPYVKRYFDEGEGTRVGDIWTDINPVNQVAKERVDYATQKPEALLERIISASTREDELVGDFFCGSGTTGVVAEKLGRRWIMSDFGRFAVHTTRKRLIDLQRDLHQDESPYRAFDLYNLGRYERQWWQKESLAGANKEHRRVVLEFYKAEILEDPPSPYLHGRKAGVYCHVDDIDGLLTRTEVAAISQAVAQVGGGDVACLAWEFEMDLRMECNRLEKEHDIGIKLIQIPREIMERNRLEPPPFLEVATLEAEPVFREHDGRRTVDIKLTSFIPSLAEVPTKELEALQDRATDNGFDFIDFWAVDFDHENGSPFNHNWQDYRTRRDRSLKTVSEQHFIYPDKGTYTACVKVVDIFGCDTSISVPIVYD